MSLFIYIIKFGRKNAINMMKVFLIMFSVVLSDYNCVGSVYKMSLLIHTVESTLSYNISVL